MAGKRQQKRQLPGRGPCPHFWRLLLIVMAIAFVLRLAAGLQLHAHYPPAAHPAPSTDMATYLDLARQLLEGEYPYEEGFYYQPFYYAVFLPIVLLAGGGSTVAVTVAQALLGGLTVLLVGLTFALLFGRWAGLWGALLLALARMHIFYTPFMLIAVLQSCLVALTVYLAVLAYRRDRLWLWALTALACGVANATRGNMVLIVPLIALILVWRRRKAWRPALLGVLVLAGCFYLPQLPFAWVNYQAHDRWTGPSSAAGAVLALGNTPEAPPGGREADQGAGPMEYPAASTEWSRQASLEGEARVPVSVNMWQWFKREPLAYLELKFRMLLLFWHRGEIPNNVALLSQGRPIPSFVATMPLLDFLLFGSLGLAGLVLSLIYHRHRRAVWLAAGVVLIYCGSIVLFYMLARFRVPIVPMICGFAGYALVCLYRGYQRYKQKQDRTRLLTGLLVYLVSLGIVGGGFDLYRHGLEKHVISLVRPAGVQVELQDEWLVKDHGPFSFGGWQPVPIGDVESVEKTFVLPDALADLGPSKAPYVRLPVGSEGTGMIQVSLAGQPPSSHTLQPGLQWLRLESEVPIDWETVELQVGYQATAPVSLIFDTQRDYDRTRIDGRLPESPGELVVELRIPKGD